MAGLNAVDGIFIMLACLDEAGSFMSYLGRLVFLGNLPRFVFGKNNGW